jgi:tRNA(fMet)-specific endonuclease VapC
VKRRYLLDTDILFQPLKKKPDPGLVRRLRRHQDEAATAAPVWHELLFGCRRLPDSKRRDWIERYLLQVVAGSLPILPYDEAAAGWHASERQRLESLGGTPPFVDGQIAAIAAVNELVLVTGNRSHYHRFEGLEIEDWSD